MLRVTLKIIAATMAFSLLHSFFANDRVKSKVRAQIGVRNYNGWYRVFYSLQSLLSLAALLVYICSLPNKILYQARGRLALVMRWGQILSVLAQIHTAFQVGIGGISGLGNLYAWLRGKKSIAPPPEAQGPSLETIEGTIKGENVEDGGEMRDTGLFRISRHPLNLLGLPTLWLQPRMTTRWASFSVIATLYFYFGSVIETRRLRMRYGRAYLDYERSGVPFFFPRLTPPHKSDKPGQDGPE